MAIYATALGRDHIKPGLGATMETGLEAASQSYKKGSPLIHNATGQLAIAVVSSAKVADVVGIADADATGTTNADAPFYPIEDTEFTAIVNASTASSAHLLVQDDVGQDYALATSASTGVWYVNKAEETASKTSVVVMRLVDAVNTAAGRCVVKFKRSTDTTIF